MREGGPKLFDSVERALVHAAYDHLGCEPAIDGAIAAPELGRVALTAA